MNETFVTPDTVSYLYLGLAAVAVISLLFIGSLVARFRGLQADLNTLEQLRDE